MAASKQAFRCSAAFFLFLLLTLPQGGQSFFYTYTQLKTLQFLSHKLFLRVADLRRARGDLDGYRRAADIARRLNRGLGWRDVLSMSWYYARRWREFEYAELYGAVSEMKELPSLVGDFAGGGNTEAERAAWVDRNYGKVQRVFKSVLGRLLKVFSKSGALRGAIETIQMEVVEGGLLRDCIEIVGNEFTGFIQIFKDLSLFNSPPDRDRAAEL